MLCAAAAVSTFFSSLEFERIYISPGTKDTKREVVEALLLGGGGECLSVDMVPLGSSMERSRRVWEARALESAVGTFTSTTELRVWCGTYNVNGKRERAIALS